MLGEFVHHVEISSGMSRLTNFNSLSLHLASMHDLWTRYLKTKKLSAKSLYRELKNLFSILPSPEESAQTAFPTTY